MISGTTEYILLGLALVAYGAIPPLRRALSNRTRTRPSRFLRSRQRTWNELFAGISPRVSSALPWPFSTNTAQASRRADALRVQLAALKLAGGDTDKLRINIDAAKRDYRDVLVPAEYPQHSTSGFRGRKPPARERQKLIDLDWKQYERWLRR